MTVYVLQLKTWFEWDRAHHTYGRIHWEMPEPCDHPGRLNNVCTTCGVDASEAGFHSAESTAEPDSAGFCTIRHETRESCVAGARRWFADHAAEGDVLLVGTWGLGGMETVEEVLEGTWVP